MRQGSIGARHVEVVLSGLLGVYLSKQFPNEDSAVTRLRELGEEEYGVLISIGDKEFKVTVEEVP